MTELDKDNRYYKAREWYDRPAYYIERGEIVDKGRVETDILHKQRNKDVAERVRKATI